MARTVLSYGNSRTRKTSQLAMAMRYLYEKSGGKPVRLVSADRGDWKGVLAREIRAGICIPFGFEVRSSEAGDEDWAIKYAPSLIRKLSLGYWPKVLEDGAMVLGKANEEAMTAPNTGDNVLTNFSGYAFEGLTSLGDVLMDHLVMAGRKISEEVVGQFEITLPGMKGDKFGANNRSHYGFVQREILGMLRRVPNLPVDRVLLTAHEAVGEEEDTKKPIRGPAVVGKAITSRLLRDVGMVLHHESYDGQEKTQVKGKDGKSVESTRMVTSVKMFFESHPDPLYSNVYYLAGPRVPPESLAAIYEKWPQGYLEPGKGYGTGGLDDYLRLEDELAVGGDSEMETWKKRVLASKQATSVGEVKK